VEGARMPRPEILRCGREALGVLVLRGLGHGAEHGGGVRLLAGTPVLPAAKTREGGERGDDGADHIPAVVLPPRLQLGNSFLLFEIVGSGHRHLISLIASARGSNCCEPSLRRGFKLTWPDCTSASPSITAKRAPLASAFFICDLKLPPAPSTTASPASRICSEIRQAMTSAPSPACTTNASGPDGASTFAACIASTARSIPIPNPQAGVGLPPSSAKSAS